MPPVDAVLLPICVGLTLIGVIITGIAWRRGRRGRVIQGVGLALAPVALYLSGLLRLLWNGVVAVGRWATGVILSPAVWIGLGLLGLCLVLWVVGGLIARRSSARRRTAAVSDRSGTPTVAGAPGAKSVGQQRGAPTRKAQPTAEDDDMAEIEALLKARGIE